MTITHKKPRSASPALTASGALPVATTSACRVRAPRQEGADNRRGKRLTFEKTSPGVAVRRG